MIAAACVKLSFQTSVKYVTITSRTNTAKAAALCTTITKKMESPFRLFPHICISIEVNTTEVKFNQLPPSLKAEDDMLTFGFCNIKKFKLSVKRDINSWIRGKKTKKV